MEKEEASYNIGVIRQLCLEAFTARELRSFIQDREPLRPIVHRFGPGYGLYDMVSEVLDHCQEHLLLDLLLAEIQKVNPRQFKRFENRLRISPEALAGVPCPYRGLEPFEVEHAENYFGRQPMIRRLIEGVRQHPFVTVVGPSGCGKSSLVRAGLMTALRFGLLPNSRAWAVLIFRPGADPLYALCRQWIALLQPEAKGVTQQLEATSQAAALADGSLSTRNIVADLRNMRPDIPHVLLIVDQFEELYTECRDGDRRRAFVQALLMAAEEQGVSVVLTLRADFYGHVLADRRLGQAVDACAINVLPMSERELREAIEKPTHRVTRSFESGLVDRILEDVAGEPGNLPLLEFALLKLWEKQTAGGLLTHQAYEEIERVKGAIAQHAEEVYGQLASEQRAETVQCIFLRLTHYGDGANETRRQALLTDLITPRTPQEEVEPVVQALARARLLVTGWAETPLGGGEAPPTAGPATGSGEGSRTATVEIAHEALIQSWERLRDWLAEDRAFGLWRAKLAASRRTWVEARRDEGALLRGATLSEAEGWLDERGQDLNRAECGFIEASLMLRAREEAQREAQQCRDAQLTAERRTSGRLRRLAAGLLLAVLVAIVLAGTALFLWNEALGARERAEGEAQARATAQIEAEVQRDQAQAARQEADALKLAFASENQLEQNHELALLLAIEARRAGPSLEADTALWAWFNSPGRTLQILAGHDRQVGRAAWSPDGQWIVTASEDGTARVWDAATGQELAQLAGHQGGVARVAWHPDGERILTSGCDQPGELGACVRSSARVWQVPSWQEVAVLEGQSQWVMDAAWSPDGRYVVTSGQDGSTRLYDADSGAELAVLGVQEHAVRAVAWSPDGRHIVTACFDNRARVWDVSTPAELGAAGVAEGAILEGHTRPIWSVAWSPDGGRIVTCSQDGTAQVWDVESGSALAVLRHDAMVWYAAWDGDGQRIATCSSDGTARLWTVPDPAGEGQEVEPDQILEHGAAVPYVAWDSSSQRVVTAGYDGTARIWDADRGALLATLTGHQGAVQHAAWDPEGRRLVTSSADGTARVWAAGGGTESAVLRGHQVAVVDAAWDPSGRRVLTTSADQTARVWDPWTGQEPATLATLAPLVAYATWAGDGQRILTAGSDGTVRLWDASTGKEWTAFGPLPGPLLHAAWAEEDQRIIGLGVDGNLTVWDATTGSQTAVLPAPAFLFPQAVAWSVDRQRLVVTSAEGAVHVADLAGVLDPVGEAGSGLAVLAGQAGQVQYAAPSPDGRRIVTAGRDAIVRVWDVSTASGAGELLVLTGHSDWVYHAAWDPEGRRLVTSSGDDTARVWDAESGATLTVLQGHRGAVVNAAWSPDGRRIVTGSNDGTARLWDAATGETLSVLPGHTAVVVHVAWDRQGQYVVTASYDGTARIYFAGFEDMVAFACQRSVRNLSADEWRRYLGDEPARETCPGKPVPQEQP